VNKTGKALSTLGLGIFLLLIAWLLPYNLSSLTLPLLKRAGQDTPGVAMTGQEWVQSEKIGPASLLLQASQNLGDPGAAALAESLKKLNSQHSNLIAWGGWDPFLEPLVKDPSLALKRESTPAINLLIGGETRKNLSDYLANSRSLGVQTLLKLRKLDRTGHFVPALKPGGQALDGLLLLSALLYQGEHFSPALQREVRAVAETSVNNGELGALEPLLFDLLSLSRRLDWVQLCELLRRTEDTKTVGEYAQLCRVAPDSFPLIYAAALFSTSADKVAGYLLQYGKAGLEDLRTAMSLGQGATRLLLDRQLPLNRRTAPAPGELAALGILYPRMALALRWSCFFLGIFLMLVGTDHLLFQGDREQGPTLPHLKSGILSLLLGVLLAMATEPYLLKAAPISEYTLRLTLPALSGVNAPPAPQSSLFNMDTSTLLSICFFAVLQVGMYLLCLQKIREISRSSATPLLKLKLMENEENLFDGGLYIGIAGTATALVLQVLKVIEPNLLAAYSSNLFGITCVALVKIRHVRPFKRSLILEGQVEASVK
jgi:hypothetical protein